MSFSSFGVNEYRSSQLLISGGKVGIFHLIDLGMELDPDGIVIRSSPAKDHLGMELGPARSSWSGYGTSYMSPGSVPRVFLDHLGVALCLVRSIVALGQVRPAWR